MDLPGNPLFKTIRKSESEGLLPHQGRDPGLGQPRHADHRGQHARGPPRTVFRLDLRCRLFPLQWWDSQAVSLEPCCGSCGCEGCQNCHTLLGEEVCSDGRGGDAVTVR